jgi:HSP20 family protein
MLFRTDPFRTFDELSRELFGTTRTGYGWMPMDAVRRGEVVEVSFDLPGIDPDSVELTVERNLLTVKAERRLDLADDAQVITRERPHGTLSRTLTMPVAEAAKPRRIEITTNGAKAITGTSHPAS